MKDIHSCQWKPFRIEDIAEIDSGCDIYEQERNVGQTPYVTATASNNGVGYFVGNSNSTLERGCISVNRNGSVGYAFYHPYLALYGNDTRKVRLHNKSGYVALFVTLMILKQRDKYAYGYKMGTARLRKQRILLPIDGSGNPDYTLMDAYMRQLEKYQLLLYANGCVPKDVKMLRAQEWGDYSIADLFRIEAGKRLESYNMKEGNRPFIGASDSNNGITNFVSNDNASRDKNVLGVNYDGSIGEAFYHPYEALFSDPVKRFHLKQIPDDKYVLLFLKAAILKQKDKFDYGYKFNAERMARQRLVLPKSPDGKPDYSFMRRFMMNAEAKLRRRYAEARLTMFDGVLA